MEHAASKAYVTHLYLMSDSPDFSDRFYALVDDLMKNGWGNYAKERNDRFVHLINASHEKPWLQALLQHNPWLRAFAFRQPLAPDPKERWTAHLEFGAYGAYATQSLEIRGLEQEEVSDHECSSSSRKTLRDRSRLPIGVGNKSAAREAVAKCDRAFRVRLAFHGRPDEIHQCIDFAAEILAEQNVAFACDSAGNEQYQMFEISYETVNGPPFRLFNHLVARVSQATIALEYTDPSSGQRRGLRSIDGRISHSKGSPV